ncbi:MAG: GTPase HflX [Ruminococcaceae bacterium]|nr:GTPase HflX [Oscillospiraceae bacterium]
MEESVKNKKAVLVSVARSSRDISACERSLDELARLLDTAGGEEAARVIQLKPVFHPATVIGSGKVSEIAELCKNQGITLAVFDMELSPSQIRNLEDGMDTEVLVLDRSMLILDIFALHARSGEGKLQVELAQLRYTAPRLTGRGRELSRLGGTIGTRGPGESKLEEDRRHIRHRIDALGAALKEMEKNRATMRAARERSGIPKIAIVGYTNAGKSTLLNALTDAGVLSEDKLFATLDPTTRKLTLPEGEEVLLTDTVGLIRGLPHHLIEAFHSTLEEAALADVLLLLADYSDEEREEQVSVTLETLRSLGAEGKPTLFVYNKCDAASDPVPHDAFVPEDTVYISAKTGEGIDKLLSSVERLLREGKHRVLLTLPYSESGLLNAIYGAGTVENVAYEENGISVTAVLDQKAFGKYGKYIVKEMR